MKHVCSFCVVVPASKTSDRSVEILVDFANDIEGHVAEPVAFQVEKE